MAPCDMQAGHGGPCWWSQQLGGRGTSTREARLQGEKTERLALKCTCFSPRGDKLAPILSQATHNCLWLQPWGSDVCSTLSFWTCTSITHTPHTHTVKKNKNCTKSSRLTGSLEYNIVNEKRHTEEYYNLRQIPFALYCLSVSYVWCTHSAPVLSFRFQLFVIPPNLH